ncbi:hypothetical protein M899_3210 [Bacteriovorax sp. BSW11_IV]|uniref:hypothetical protein n=1 Tax=Bacteriovorax sp. BSW11_IV TaxID=1353529 RepID=UPI00038A197C|nr:hypothetical protein [Bacteriovorax sp. BSW11_IV]EQC48224.1 hypothetical protein M899_3210 [Bacteriovorax sp. BSW11_IV]
MKQTIKSLLCTLFAIFSFFTYGVELSVTKENNLKITASTCDEVLFQREAICQWKKNLDPSFEIPKVSKNACVKNKNKTSIVVSKCIPDLVKEIHHKKLNKSGANCWGTALGLRGLSQTPRFVWSNELQYWQSSPLCRKLSVGESLRPGDIINTYGPEYIFREEGNDKGTHFWNALYPNRYTVSPVDNGYSGYHNLLHSETFISYEMTFGKDSPNFDDRFDFHQMIEVYGRTRDKDCQENQSLTPHMRENQNEAKRIKGTKCDYMSLAYRCQRFDSYFNSIELSDIEKGLWSEIQDLFKKQNTLFKLLTIKNFKLSNFEVIKLITLSDEVARLSLNELSKGLHLSKNEEMLLTLRYFTASAIRKSLELADEVEPTEPL